MALEIMRDDVRIIQGLSDYPNQEEGLSAQEMKAKFDEAAVKLQGFINDSVVPAVNDKLSASELPGAVADAVEKTLGSITPAKIGAAPASHVSDKSNPHGVTASQVGARPSTWNPSFFPDALNTNFRNGLLYGGSPTNPLYMAIWDGDESATGTQPNRRVRSIDAAGARSLMGAAPSGYGYGGSAISLGHYTTEDALTTALAAVYDAMANGETKLITFAGYPSPSDWRWFGILTKSSANNGSFVAQSTYNEGSQIMKAKYNGTWQPTEWQNPPMEVGVEYRTTERWNNKVVYTKTVSLGTLPNATTKTVTHGAFPTAVLRVSAVTSTGITLPYRSGDSIGEISANRIYLFVYYNYDASSATGTAQIWYTKD